jgi:glutamate racemase
MSDTNERPGQLPIGVFDSGLGGLTGVHAIREALPNEDILYLGDTARVPYGTRSPQTVMRYARGCASALVRRGIKMLVVACNTVSAVAIETLQSELAVPVLGVIAPGARAACRSTRSNKIGVIGTTGMIASGAYAREVARVNSTAEVFGVAAPLFVPLVEEGWLEGEVPRLATHRYLTQLANHRIDTLVLGCTHYPMLRVVIEHVAHDVLGPDARVIDSAEATAHELRETIGTAVPRAEEIRQGRLHLMVTDLPQAFAGAAARFLGHAVDDVEVIDL